MWLETCHQCLISDFSSNTDDSLLLVLSAGSEAASGHLSLAERALSPSQLRAVGVGCSRLAELFQAWCPELGQGLDIRPPGESRKGCCWPPICRGGFWSHCSLGHLHLPGPEPCASYMLTLRLAPLFLPEGLGFWDTEACSGRTVLSASILSVVLPCCQGRPLTSRNKEVREHQGTGGCAVCSCRAALLGSGRRSQEGLRGSCGERGLGLVLWVLV